MIPVFRPCYDEREIAALTEPFRNGWVGLGPKTDEFEREFSKFVRVPYAVGVNSATAALNLALKLADVEGGEVITTPMTFVSSNHAILYNGGIPVFSDIEADTLNIDPTCIRKLISNNTRAIVVVHYGGHSCDMEQILDIASTRGIPVVEDCAHACGGMYKDRMLGSMGKYGCFSFHAVKNLATGDGGMITVHSVEDDTRLRKLRWLGISKDTWIRSEHNCYSWEYDISEVGYKCHMNDITAAIGLVQLDKLSKSNSIRRQLAERYSCILSSVEQIELPVQKSYAKSAFHNYVIKVRNPEDRNPLIEHLKLRGVSTGVHYYPNHLYGIYSKYVHESLPVVERIWRKLITIPLFPDLTYDQQDIVAHSIQDYFSSK